MMKTEVGFSQLENRCPAALPTGTRARARGRPHDSALLGLV